MRSHLQARGRVLVAVAVVIGLALVALAAWMSGDVEGSAPFAPRTQTPHGQTPHSDDHRSPALPDSAPLPPSIRYLAIGGGSEPSSTQISLEQDLGLAERVLPGPGVLFFAGGPGTQSVQSLPEIAPHPPNGTSAAEEVIQRARSALGDLFDPRYDRSAVYRSSRLGARRATEDAVYAALESALGPDATTAPLLVYIAAHGDRGETARENLVALWEGGALRVDELAALHDQASRPLRLVVASCYSGGFGELAFHGADAALGPARVPRCGLFAGPWDAETSGCDPNPVRAAQEGYSIHFLHALAGKDRTGAALDPAADVNGDGRINLLEAHTWARVASRSIDIPTTTSERYLREVVREEEVGALALGAVAADETLPQEEQLVIARLGAQLGVATLSALSQAMGETEAAAKDLDDKLDAAETELHHAEIVLATRLLEQWPILSDPWHPDFEAALRSHGAEVLALIEHSAWAHKRHQALEHLTSIDDARMTLEPRVAALSRLSRARHTWALAEALSRRADIHWAHYQKLLTCERTLP